MKITLVSVAKKVHNKRRPKNTNGILDVRAGLILDLGGALGRRAHGHDGVDGLLVVLLGGSDDIRSSTFNSHAIHALPLLL